MLVELLRLSGGGGAELVRRWVVALLSVPADERAGLVDAVEQEIAREYALPELTRAVSAVESETLLDVASEATQKRGYSEVVVRSYAAAKPSRKKKRGRAGESAA